VSVRITQWNAGRLLAKVAQTLEKAGPVYQEETIRQMSNPIWQWNWDTKRKVSLLMGGEQQGLIGGGMSGVVVRAGKRDVVDTGRLLDSITRPFVVRQGSSASLVIAWKAPYARVVLGGGDYGSYTPPGQSEPVRLGQRPARNWIQAAYESKPPDRVFAEIWRSFRGT
jgi:hypothetical protein